MEKYLPYLLSAAWVILLCGLVFFVSGLFRTGRKGAALGAGPDKARPDEGGRVHIGHRLLIAIAAVLLSGVLMLFPMALVFKESAKEGRGTELFMEIALFVAVLSVALAHAWKKNDLRWLSGDDAEEIRDGDTGKRTA
ncbi:MAG: NADH-quinone oxidoreductase subunit A [Deltaproteobacteria bacterium]|nr:NADH-quinone oxidoreductase subunit A [Deltaproteobacteria bacterium]